MSKAVHESAGSGPTWLFVPGDRPDRFAKATMSGADHVIIDLEDSVAPPDKSSARRAAAAHLRSGPPCWVRINAEETPWFGDDLDALARTRPAGVLLPKAEDVSTLRTVAARLPGTPVVALVETALGVANALDIAAAPEVSRLAFGSIDFALDIDADHEAEVMTYARSRLVLMSRAAGAPPPIDGVTPALDAEITRSDAEAARALGMGGKLCIHPLQLEPVARAFRPTTQDVEYARRVVAAAAAHSHGAATVDGRMVDKPVLARAYRVLANLGDSVADVDVPQPPPGTASQHG